jgi:hypothetical protein
MNRYEWLVDFRWTSDALAKFAERTHIPAPVPHLLLGCAIDDTRAVLAIPTRFLLGLIKAAPSIGDPMVEADIDNEVVNRLQVVHRTFYAGTFNAVEAGLRYICDEHGWEVEPQRKRQMRGIIARTREAVDATPIERELNRLERTTQNMPACQDFLEEVLQRKQLDEEVRDRARQYFPLLRIFRNKCSHPGSAMLTPLEIKSLRDANLSGFVAPTGELSFHPRSYPHVGRYLLNFLSRVYAAPNRHDGRQTQPGRATRPALSRAAPSESRPV